MNSPSKLWINFKSHPDIWFFYGFLVTFTLSIRKVIIDYPIAGQFNEWVGIYLYLSDILLIMTLLLWGIFILRHKSYDLSIDSIILWLKQAKIYLPLLLIIWSFISIFWSENQNIALFKAIKSLELYLLYLYTIYQIVPRGTFLRNVFRIIIISGLIQAIIGIGQFILQHSIGLFWLKESLISPDIPGVAKIVLHGEKYIRSYGLFPHPNILGGFLLFSIILTIFWKKLFRVEQLKKCHPELDSGSNKLDSGSAAGMTILAAIQILALILTFSKSAILGLIIALVYLAAKFRWRIMAYIKLKSVIIGLIIILLLLIMVKPDVNSIFCQSTGERIFYLNVSPARIAIQCIAGGRETIGSVKTLILGVGSGNYMFHVEHNYPNLESWQFQPVHNVFLLILSELGLVGVFIFIWFLWKMFHVKQFYNLLSLRAKRSNPEVIDTNNEIAAVVPTLRQDSLAMTISKSILFAFIFVMLFDHYLWDIQQGQIMLWLVLGIIAGVETNRG